MNVDIQNVPTYRATQFDKDLTQRQLHTILDNLYKVQDALRNLGPTPMDVSTGEASSYATAVTNLKADITTAIGRVRVTIDALLDVD